jgi:2-polyprenyl-3-methyl-5-hydroxy-6-metoxy-1,4-benzoquinol methylase
MSAATAKGKAKAAARRVLIERLRLVPRSSAVRPYAVPGFAPAAELRWRWRVRRRPVLSASDYARRVTVGEIEELVACPLCGEDRVQPLLDPGRPGRWGYHVVRCPACGLLYRNPGIRPERLGELYSAGGYGKFLTGHYGRGRQREYERIMDEFAPALASGAGRRLLDYGSGAGLFLEVAARRGFEGHGVDLSPDAVELARRRPGGERSHVGTPLEVPEVAAGGFDVVTMWSVLAHLPRPVEDLTMLRQLLSAEGMLLVSTVNANSLTLKVDGARWAGFTPNHLAFFSPRTLPALLRAAGFGAVVFRPMYAIPDPAKVPLRPAQLRRLRRSVERGNQGRMLRALAFASPDGPARWGLDEGVVRLA